jgi:hypothetical protein
MFMEDVGTGIGGGGATEQLALGRHLCSACGDASPLSFLSPSSLREFLILELPFRFPLGEESLVGRLQERAVSLCRA